MVVEEKQTTLNGSIIDEDHIDELRKIREQKVINKSTGISLKPSTKLILDDFQYELKRITGQHPSHDYIISNLLNYREQLKKDILDE